MNYSQTLQYLYQQLPMFSRMGSAAFKKDLTNIRILCDHLGNPQKRFKSIHVAGTNGKGSTSHMLAAILEMAGYKTGLYTSPHLYDFRERIKLNGQMVPKEFVVRFVKKHQRLMEEIEPSFFEITVAMAFQFFAEESVAAAIVEVGLGGRLDSTNIITPDLSIITNIGWDHMNMLGNTLEEIAAEKAGIIKQNVPVVIGEAVPETKAIFQKIAEEKKAPLVWAEESFQIQSTAINPSSLHVELRKKNASPICVKTDLGGIYQVQNIRTVLTAVDELAKLGWKLDNSVVLEALKDVKGKTGLGGRWEVIQQKPTVILEVAHNVNGIAKLMEHVRQLQYQQLHLIIGMVKDKEVEKVLALLPKTANYYFTQAGIARALPATELQHKAAGLALNGAAYADVNVALDTAKANASDDDLLIVCGSIFLVAEVKRL